MFSAPGFPVKIAEGIACSIVLPELTNAFTNVAEPGLITPAASNCIGD